jgi:hypothetical protein
MAQMRGGARFAGRGKTSSLDPWRRSARFRRIASKNARANLARFEDGSGFGDAHCSASAPLIGALKRLAHGMLLLSWTGAEIERRECAKLDAGRATIPHNVESYRRAWRPGRRVRSSRIAHVWPKPVPRLDIFEALGPRVSARTRRSVHSRDRSPSKYRGSDLRRAIVAMTVEAFLMLAKRGGGPVLACPAAGHH